MIWPFRRRKKQKPLPPINEDWRAGDLAECIEGRPWSGNGVGPANGQICRVTRVFLGRSEATGELGYGLNFVEFCQPYDAACFCKIRPLHKACDEEFAALVKRAKHEKAR